MEGLGPLGLVSDILHSNAAQCLVGREGPLGEVKSPKPSRWMRRTDHFFRRLGYHSALTSSPCASLPFFSFPQQLIDTFRFGGGAFAYAKRSNNFEGHSIRPPFHSLPSWHAVVDCGQWPAD
jgi:hypothetical protein